ncbi:hypothetical protein MRX96_046381 [Rhipicephalus microplus]
MWDHFTAEELVTPENDDQVVAIFMTIRKAILRDLLSSWIFDSSDVDKLRRHFSNLTVITTSVFMETPIALPTSTEGFVENLIRASDYDFLGIQMYHCNTSWPQDIIEYDPLPIYNKTRYFIMPNIYDSVSVRPSHSTLLNMALVNQLLADALWYVAYIVSHFLEYCYMG